MSSFFLRGGRGRGKESAWTSVSQRSAGKPKGAGKRRRRGGKPPAALPGPAALRRMERRQMERQQYDIKHFIIYFMRALTQSGFSSTISPVVTAPDRGGRFHPAEGAPGGSFAWLAAIARKG